MIGAFSFVLGLLGLGTAGVVSGVQTVKREQKIAEYKHEAGYDARGNTAEMYNRVEREWIGLIKTGPNAAGKWVSEYPGYPYIHSGERNWFKDHLDIKGIPYDDVILDRVTGVLYEKQMERLRATGYKPRRRIF